MTIPACKHYGDCGGCQLQHLDAAAYRAAKMATASELLAAIGVPALPLEWVWGAPATRRRAEFKADKEGNFGFYKAASREVVAIEECPALVPELAALIPALTSLCKSQRGVEKIFVTAADSGVDIDVSGKAPAAALQKLPAQRITLNGSLVLQHQPIRMQFSESWVELAPGGFLQPTREGQAAITQIIRSMVPKAKKIAEFFSGMGTYSFMLSEIAPVAAYEFSETAVAALNKARGTRPIQAEARNLEKFPVQPQEMAGVDVAVLNPPRNGAGPQCKALGKSGVKRIVMVSCHPETLARDLGILIKAGFTPKRMVAIDQFHWTHHLESVVLLER